MTDNDDEYSPSGVNRLIDEYVELARWHKKAIKTGLDYGRALLDLADRSDPPTKAEVRQLGIDLINSSASTWDQSLGKFSKEIKDKDDE